MKSPSIQVFPTPSALAFSAARTISQLASSSISHHGKFSIALPGGNTPKPLYDLLASEDFSRQIDWPNCEIYFTDERCVPPVHPDSNFRLISETLLDVVPLKPEHIHRMKGEFDPETTAKEYGQLLKDKFGDFGPDLILLGLGTDGHTASLFPGTSAITETHHRCVSSFVPSLNASRITMSAPFINRADTVVVLITGQEKSKIVDEVLQSKPNPQKYPIHLIAPTSNQFLWLMDAAAAGMADDDED